MTPTLSEQDWDSLLTLLFGAWEDSGILQEQEAVLAKMARDRKNYSEDVMTQIKERIDWMNGFYQRVVLPATLPTIIANAHKALNARSESGSE